MSNSRRRWSFWTGVVAVTVGVCLHLPMYWHARETHFHMAHMPMDGTMKAGMALLVAGIGLSAYGLLSRGGDVDLRRVARLRVRALDDARIRRAHVALLTVMATAVTIDVMKPTALAFVMPGMVEEYGLRSPLNPDGGVPVALLPLCALIGLTIGALWWGRLADHVGRRSSILLAVVMFIATAVCGAMPSFWWNLLMCFLMGAAAGGMLPIVFSLLAETIPARHRSWLMVLLGGDIAGAYLLTSWLSSVLQPHFGWRIMWLLGLPSAVALILLSRWIPESPRFLLATGRAEEAEQVMRRFGARIEYEGSGTVDEAVAIGYRQVFTGPLAGITVCVAMFGLGWGLVNNGFLLWLPTNLREAGLDVGAADGLLASAALIGFPVIIVVALLYGFCSSKWTMIGFAGLNTATLTAFALLGESVADSPALLRVLVVLLLVGTAAMLATLTPYSSEVYPTVIRARGSGLAGACARAGGLLGVGLVVAGVTPPTLTVAATVGAVSTALAALAVARFGVETRRRRLEEITAVEFGIPPAAAST